MPRPDGLETCRANDGSIETYGEHEASTALHLQLLELDWRNLLSNIQKSTATAPLMSTCRQRAGSISTLEAAVGRLC